MASTTTDRDKALRLSFRICAHCQQPIEGPPYRRGSITLHPACFRDYVPRAPTGETPFVPAYKARGETVLDGRWQAFLAKYRQGDEGITPTVPPVPKRAVNSPGNLKEGIGFVNGKCHAKGKGKYAEAKPALRVRTPSRAADAEAFRPVPDLPGIWVAANGRVERRRIMGSNSHYPLKGAKGNPDHLRLITGGTQRNFRRSELVRAVWGDVFASEEGGAT